MSLNGDDNSIFITFKQIECRILNSYETREMMIYNEYALIWKGTMKIWHEFDNAYECYSLLKDITDKDHPLAHQLEMVKRDTI